MQKSLILILGLVFSVLTTSQALALQCRSLFPEVSGYAYEEAVVDDAQSADGQLRLSLGGIGEVPNAVNINILVDPRHAGMNIPHLIKSDMREMPFLKNNSVDQMFCFACPGAHTFFEEVVTEAHRVMKPGATFQITSNSSSVGWINALNKLGFKIERYNERSVVARKVSDN